VVGTELQVTPLQGVAPQKGEFSSVKMCQV
jgi:hypothetical protein